jgi:hypothetical protein
VSPLAAGYLIVGAHIFLKKLAGFKKVLSSRSNGAIIRDFFSRNRTVGPPTTAA